MKSTQTRMSGVGLTQFDLGNWMEFAAIIAAFIVVGAVTFGLF